MPHHPQLTTHRITSWLALLVWMLMGLGVSTAASAVVPSINTLGGTLSLPLPSGAGYSYLALSGLPPGAGLDPLTGTLNLRPASTVGSYSVTVQITDAAGGVTQQVIPVEVTNTAPTAASRSYSVMQGYSIGLTLQGEDLDGQPLSYRLLSQPSHGSLIGSAPNLVYIPTPGYIGPDSLGFVVNDGLVDSASGSINLTVLAGTTTNGSIATAQLAVGDNHSLLLQPDGTLLAWGNNQYGQLGDGSTTQRTTPVMVVDGSGVPVSGIQAVGAGTYHSLALKSDGTLLAWGYNSLSQLGDGSNTSRTTPVVVVDASGAPINGVQAMVSGNYHSLALKSDGTLLAWGWNPYGQLGDGTTTNHTTPVLVVDASGAPVNGVQSLAAGSYHSLALKSDGTLLAWGYNPFSQLGDGTTTNRTTPVVVMDASGAPVGGVLAVVAGLYHSVALKSDGTLLAWGNDLYGQLGDGSTTWHTTPVVVVDGSGAVVSGVLAVVAGTYHSLALKSDGTLLAWGDNRNGQLGDGSTTRRTTPVMVVDGSGAPVSGVQAVVAGGSHGLALKTDGTLLAWGNNQYGQLGDGSTTQRTTPVVVVDGGGVPVSGVHALGAGGYHSLALKSDGTLLAWGDNLNGQLGDGSTMWHITPVVVVDGSGAPVSGVQAVVTGANHSLALKFDGTLLAWGQGGLGQLGDGSTLRRTTPVGVVDGSGAPISGIQAVAVGVGHSLALKSDGTLLAWGYNAYGQLGDGSTTTHSSTPVVVVDGSGTPVSGVQAVAAGNYHSLALKLDGTLLAWGYNPYGQLGDGSIMNRPTPVVVVDSSGSPVSGVQAVAAGSIHSLALKSDGTLLAWGNNTFSQLGDGSNTSRTTPVVVVNASGVPVNGVQALAAGTYHSLALKSDGTLLAWGDNQSGQLGDGSTTRRTTPVVVVDGNGAPVNGVQAVVAGAYHSLALKNDQSIIGWGQGGDGQLSYGTSYQFANPVLRADGSALPVLPAYSLVVNLSGTGAGTVTDGITFINCGSQCQATYNSGTLVTLTPTPATGSLFVGWSGACTGTGTCVVAVDQERWVAAEFAPLPNSLPVVNAGSAASVVEGVALSLAGSFTDADHTDSHTLFWEFGDGATAAGTLTPSHTWTNNGLYTVTLTVGDNQGGVASSSVQVTVTNAAPVVSAGANASGNEGQSIAFSGGFSDMGVNDSHALMWDFGDGSSAVGTLTPSHTYTDNGSYTVTLSVTDNDGGVGRHSIVVSLANLPPVVNLGADQSTNEGAAFGTTPTITDPGSADTFPLYQWDFGDGTTATGMSPAHSYTDNGSYTLLLTVTDDDGGVGSDSVVVTVSNVVPTADAGAAQSANEGDTVAFSGAATDPGTLDTHTYAWDFGDGNTASGQSASHIYADNGSYTATLTVTDKDGGVGSSTQTVTIANLPPTADAGAAQSAAEGAVVSFSGGAADAGSLDTHTYAWEFGDGSTASGQTASHVYADNGIYRVTLTVTDNSGGVGSSTQSVTVANVAPSADAGVAQSADEGATVNFSGSATDPGSLDTHTYSWDFGDGTTASGQSASHVYADNGVYTVTLTVTDNDGGVGTATQTVTIANVAPTASAGGAQSANEGATVNFSGNATDPGSLDTHTYQWAFGDGTTASGQSVRHVYVDNGVYTVTLTVTDKDGGVGTSNQTVTIANVAPVANAGAPLSGNEGEGVAFSGGVTDLGVADSHTYQWAFGDGTSASGQNVSHVYADNGVYTATLMVTDNSGAVGTATQSVTIANLAPTAQLSATPITGGDYQLTASVSDTGSLDTHQLSWALGDGTTQSGAGPITHRYTGAGPFTISLTVVDNDGGSVTVTHNLTIADTDGDGIVDTVEVAMGFDPNDPTDGLADYDGDGRSNAEEVALGSDLNRDDVAPVFTTLPTHIEINASDVFTLVDLGVPMAVDGKDGALTPTVNSTNLLASGIHTLRWSATDAAGNTATESQTVIIHPQVNIAARQYAEEGKLVAVTVQLTGPALIEVRVPYSVAGSAAPSDHDAVAGEFVITAGSTSTSLQFNLLNDAIAGEAGETVLFTLGTPQGAGLGSARQHSVIQVEANLPPVLTLKVRQAGEVRSQVNRGEGLVTLTAVVSDANPLDTHSYDWSATANVLSDQDGVAHTLTFDPASLSDGSYPVSVQVTDIAGGTNRLETLLRVHASGVVLSATTDSDGDGVPDATEGQGDSDGDGIADYLDAIGTSAQLQSSHGLLLTEPGLRLMLGQTSVAADKRVASVQQLDIDNHGGADGSSVLNGHDGAGTLSSGYFDFVVDGLPEAGASAQVVLPLENPLPARAAYRKYHALSGWQSFVSDVNNAVHSAPGSAGACPSPNSSAYQPGLNAGDWCLRLTLEDGGPNDADGLANRSVSDPGAVIQTPPPAPAASGGGGGGALLWWSLIGLGGLALRRRVSVKPLA